MPLLYATLAALVLFICLAWLYAPALSMGISLFDEALILNSSDKVWSRWWSNGILASMRQDVLTVTALKPGAAIFYSASYALFNESRFLMHAMLLGLLVLTTAGLALAPWLELRRERRFSLPVGGAVFAGAVAALLLLGAEVPGWSGVQALRANWYRLHTSETLISASLAAHIILLLLATQVQSAKRRTIMMICAMLILLPPATTKLTAFVHLGPPAALCAMLALARRHEWKPLAFSIILSVVLAAIYTLTLTTIVSRSDASYAAAYTVDLSRLRMNWTFYWTSFHEMLGPIFLLVIPASVARIVCEWPRLESWRVVLERNAFLLYCLIAWLTAVAAALPWPHLLPRYLLPAHTILCFAVGFELFYQSQWWAQTKNSGRRLPFIFSGAVAVFLFNMFVIGLAVPLLAIVARFRRRENWIQGVLAGIFAVSLSYFAVFAWISHAAFQGDYVDRERVDAELAAHLQQEFRNEQALGFLGDATNERIGSIATFARRTGLSPTVRSVKAPGDLAGLDLLLVEEPTGRVSRPPFSLVMKKGFRPEGEIYRPISFWQWRRSLWKGDPRWPYQRASLPAGWTLYSIPQRRSESPARATTGRVTNAP